MLDFISTSVPCETPHYIRGNEEACQPRLVGASAALMTEKEQSDPPPFIYSRGSQFSCIPFRLSCQAWGLTCATDTAASKEFTGFCNAMQTSGEGGGVLPVIPHQILTRKSCFPCSVHSHPPGIHHTEVSNDTTCLLKQLDMRASAGRLTARLFHYFSSQFECYGTLYLGGHNLNRYVFVHLKAILENWYSDPAPLLGCWAMTIMFTLDSESI